MCYEFFTMIVHIHIWYWSKKIFIQRLLCGNIALGLFGKRKECCYQYEKKKNSGVPY